MNAVELLKDDHDKVKELFREYEAAGERAFKRKKGIAENVFSELEVHTKVEEEIFYPAVRAKSDKEGKELVAESIEDHQAVEALIEELKTMDPKDEEYDDLFQELMDSVEQHIETEESELMPKAEEKLSATLDNLGAQIQERKEGLMASVR
jgi:hemerythrin-like domain-containing protein